MSNPVRLGIVGVGALTLRALLPHLTMDDLGDAVVVEALCDPVIERADQAAKDYGVPKTYASIEELVADDQIDAVTIASPIGLHASQGKIALEAGKHVHFNKTMCTTVAEADELIALAGSDLRIVASPGEVLRPQLTRTRELIAEGAIGKVAWAACGCAFGRYHEQEEPERYGTAGGPIDPTWYFKPNGGGPLYDMTSYSLHGLTAVLGPAKRVTAISGVVVEHREFDGRTIQAEVDDNTLALLDFGAGAIALMYGTAAGGMLIDDFGAACFFGTKGEIRGLLLNGEPFDFPGRELTTHAPTSDWDAQMFVLPHVVGEHRGMPESHVFEDIMQLVEWIRAGTPSPVNAEHARHVVDIIESTYRSADTGRTEDLTTMFAWPWG